MARYIRKLDTEGVEAFQWHGGEVRGVVFQDENEVDPQFFVITIHGQGTVVAPGDWIITEPDGEHHYPCKPDVFEARYISAVGGLKCPVVVDGDVVLSRLSQNDVNVVWCALYETRNHLLVQGWRAEPHKRILDTLFDCLDIWPKADAITQPEPAEPLSEFNEPGFDADGPTDDELRERGIISEEDGV